MGRTSPGPDIAYSGHAASSGLGATYGGRAASQALAAARQGLAFLVIAELMGLVHASLDLCLPYIISSPEPAI